MFSTNRKSRVNQTKIRRVYENKIILLFGLISICLLFSLSIMAQTTGSIAGTVVDQNGAIVPNATVVVAGEGGQEFTVVTSANGTYRIPAVQNGIYTVTVSVAGFKKYVATNVKVDVGTPSTVDAALEVGDVSQVVEITTGGEVLQTETATVSTTITGRQISESPIASRNALDLVNQLPGVSTVGRPRTSSINGLPKGSLSITLDGADAQDNNNRSSDGFLQTYSLKLMLSKKLRFQRLIPARKAPATAPCRLNLLLNEEQTSIMAACSSRFATQT